MSKITQSARGEACTLRLDNCQGKSETVVFCHKNNAGMGLKSKDEDGKDVGFYGCFYCHQTYDTGSHEYYTKEFIGEMVEFAIRETDKKLRSKGLKK